MMQLKYHRGYYNHMAWEVRDAGFENTMPVFESQFQLFQIG